MDPAEAVTVSQDGNPLPTVKAAPDSLVCTDTVVEAAAREPSRLESTIWLGETASTGSAGCPACVTLTDCPAIVSVPVRDEAEELACTAMDTEPLPALDAGEVTVIHPVCETAVQEQDAPVDTETCNEPLCWLSEKLLELSV